VRARYENELIVKLRLPTTKFAFYWEEKKDRNIRKVILQLLNSYKGVKNPMRPTRWVRTEHPSYLSPDLILLKLMSVSFFFIVSHLYSQAVKLFIVDVHMYV
jgi:hypothetical protein